MYNGPGPDNSPPVVNRRFGVLVVSQARGMEDVVVIVVMFMVAREGRKEGEREELEVFLGGRW